MKTKILFSIIFIIAGIGGLYSQALIGYDSEPDGSALLELRNQNGTSSTKGILFPRINNLDTTQFNLNGSSGTEGMIVYNITKGTNNNGKGLYYWNGSHWIHMKRGDTSAEWLQGGNTNGAIQTLGTKDNFDFPFITNNAEKMRITASGNVGIGTSSPKAKLSVSGGPLSQDDFANGDKFFMMGNTKSPKITTEGGWVFGWYAGSLITSGGANANINSGQFTWNVGDASNTWREVMRLNNAGDLGIGTTNPSSNLHVAGNAILNGQVTLLNAPVSVSTENLLTLDGSANVSKSVNVILGRTTQIKSFPVPATATGATSSVTITSNTDNYFLTVAVGANACARAGIARFLVGKRKVISFLGGQSRDSRYTVTSLDGLNGSKLRLHAIMTACQDGGGNQEFDFDIEILPGNVINITNMNGTVAKPYTIIVEEC